LRALFFPPITSHHFGQVTVLDQSQCNIQTRLNSPGGPTLLLTNQRKTVARSYTLVFVTAHALNVPKRDRDLTFIHYYLYFFSKCNLRRATRVSHAQRKAKGLLFWLSLTRCRKKIDWYGPPRFCMQTRRRASREPIALTTDRLSIGQIKVEEIFCHARHFYLRGWTYNAGSATRIL